MPLVDDFLAHFRRLPEAEHLDYEALLCTEIRCFGFEAIAPDARSPLRVSASPGTLTTLLCRLPDPVHS